MWTGFVCISTGRGDAESSVSDGRLRADRGVRRSVRSCRNHLFSSHTRFFWRERATVCESEPFFFNLKLHFPVNRHFTWKAVLGLNSELCHEAQAPLPAGRSWQNEGTRQPGKRKDVGIGYLRRNMNFITLGWRLRKQICNDAMVCCWQQCNTERRQFRAAMYQVISPVKHAICRKDKAPISVKGDGDSSCLKRYLQVFWLRLCLGTNWLLWWLPAGLSLENWNIHRAHQALTAARSNNRRRTHATGSEPVADIARQVKCGKTSSLKQGSILTEHQGA